MAEHIPNTAIHYRQFRKLAGSTRPAGSLWAAWCPCGWQASVRGNKKEAAAAWREHVTLAQREMAFLQPAGTDA